MNEYESIKAENQGYIKERLRRMEVEEEERAGYPGFDPLPIKHHWDSGFSDNEEAQVYSQRGNFCVVLSTLHFAQLVQGGDEKWYTSEEEEEIKRNDPITYPEYHQEIENANVRFARTVHASYAHPKCVCG